MVRQFSKCQRLSVPPHAGTVCDVSSWPFCSHRASTRNSLPATFLTDYGVCRLFKQYTIGLFSFKITKSCYKNSTNIEHRAVKSGSPYSPPFSPPSPLSRSHLCTIFLCICICSRKQHFITHVLIFLLVQDLSFPPNLSSSVFYDSV